MPTLQNEHYELFAQSLAQGKTAQQAYSDAGYKPSRKNAWRLKTNKDIAARVQEIQAAAATSAEITLAGVLRELDEAIAIAKHKNLPNALINAASLRSRLGGLLVERQQIEVTHNFTKQGSSPDDILQAFWHSCTINCPDIEIIDEDREVLDIVLQLLRRLEDRMIGREMRRVIEQDRQTRLLTDGQRLFNTGLFNEKGRPHG